MNYTIAIASDHAGFQLKEKLYQHLLQKNIKTFNLGPHSDKSVDYPDYAKKVVDEVLNAGSTTIGILICGTGIGMSIAANRNSGIRASLCTSAFMGEKARLHNDANILVLGAQVVSEDLAISIVDKFIDTNFEGGRHSIRLGKIQ